MWFLATYLVFSFFCGCVAKLITIKKGYEHGFFWGFGLGIVGIAIVSFRPAVQQTTTYTPPPSSAPVSASTAPVTFFVKPGHWLCKCGSTNPDVLQYCQHCLKPRSTNQFNPEAPNNKTISPNQNATNNNVTPTPPPPSHPPRISADQKLILEKLESLYAKGVLTDQEYQQKKSEILSRA